MSMEFSLKDTEQIKAKGLTLEAVEHQMELFQNGLPYSNLVAPAVVDDGILKLSEKERDGFIKIYEKKVDDISVIKFVPASGAATRMFKFLFQFLKSYDPEKESINSYINNNNDRDLYTFLVGLEKFPFYESVRASLLKNYPDYESMSSNDQYLLFIKAMLDSDKLDYGNSPKGLLPFHEYKNQVISTAFEEHLFETALYTSQEKPVKIHFTISEKYKDRFIEEFKRIQDKVEQKTGSKFEISFSYQNQSTDTIAVTPDNEPFRNQDGSILFRPSGHGALVENLNELDADVIFMKNIDNVVVYRYKDEVACYKKMLGGILLDIQEKVFQYLNELNSKTFEEAELEPVVNFMTDEMQIKFSREFQKYKTKYQIEYIQEKLNRPIRICGMVKNEGEPGGGPFWVKNENGEVSLQIVESAQIDLKNKRQKSIFKGSTHFNPVDVVCGVRNYKGEKFNLKEFVDPNAAFITDKTKSGKDLKALELPGLWNGTMANWNTIFVEVPLITFNPVKTVNDLLKAPHQIKK